MFFAWHELVWSGARCTWRTWHHILRWRSLKVNLKLPQAVSGLPTQAASRTSSLTHSSRFTPFPKPLRTFQAQAPQVPQLPPSPLIAKIFKAFLQAPIEFGLLSGIRGFVSQDLALHDLGRNIHVDMLHLISPPS
jgi:hypothetical protein